MPGRGDGEDLLVAEKNHLAILEQAVVALRIAIPADRRLRSGRPLQGLRRGHVVGVHVCFQGVFEPQAVLAQQTHVALDLFDHGVDEDRFVAGVVRDEVGQRGRRRIEKLLEEHGFRRPLSKRGAGQLRGGACHSWLADLLNGKPPPAIIMQIVLAGRVQVRRIVMSVQ